MSFSFGKYKYVVLVEGAGQAEFSEVDSVDMKREPIEYRMGSMETAFLSKNPGFVKPRNVTLRWGSSNSCEFADWVKAWDAGNVDRKKVTIQLKSEEGSTICESTFSEAWVLNYTVSELPESGCGIDFEKIEFCYEVLTRTV